MRIALTLAFTLAFALPALAQGAQDNSLALPAATAAPAIAPVQPANPLQAVVTPPPAPSVKPQVLSPGDAALYRQIFAAERNGETSKARSLLAKVSDPTLEGYAEAAGLLSSRHVTIGELVDWLGRHRDLSVADRVYRLAVSHSTKKVRKHRKDHHHRGGDQHSRAIGRAPAAPAALKTRNCRNPVLRPPRPAPCWGKSWPTSRRASPTPRWR